MTSEKHLALTAKWVVTMDRRGTVYSPGYLEVKSGKILSLGPLDEVPQVERIDYKNAAIIPGLVNSHTHAAMNLFRGFADDLPLDDWLGKHIWPLEARFLSPEFVLAGTRLAILEMLKAGITMFTDMYFFEDEVARAAREAGIRVLIGEGLLAFPTASSKDPLTTFELIREQAARYHGDELVRVLMAAHSTYASTEVQLHRAAELSLLWHLPVQIHCAETQKEALECISKHKMSQIAYLDELGLLSTRIGLVHMVWPQEGDFELLNRENVGVVLCPQSNLKLASGIPPVSRYIDEGIRVVLGTDGAASNNNLDIWEELRLAALLAKGTTLDPTRLPAEQALRMVTIDSAKTWGMAEEIGSLEPGKKADLVVVDLSSAHNEPVYDVYSALVYSAGASDVRDVFVGGTRVVSNGEVTTLDEKPVLEEARSWARKISEVRNDA